MNVLEIRGVSFSYKDNRVLEDINYLFKKSRIYAIVGHNGAGKTTLIRLCLGILKNQNGIINFQQDLKKSYVPDFGGLYRFLTVEENIRIFWMLNNKKSDLMNEFIELNLKKWNLLDKRKARVKFLSMGQRQRLSLIVSEVNNPDILFFDEPTNSIDLASQEFFNNHLISLKELGKTIIIATHDISLIEKISDELIILDSRKIVYSGQTSSIENITYLYRKLTGKVYE